jgi:uncharacterized protein
MDLWTCRISDILVHMSMPSRDAALSLLYSHLSGDYVRRHSLATEAVMRLLAQRLNSDAELWSTTGLLHDLDLELVGDDMRRHGRETVRILKGQFEFPANGLQAILAHNGDVLGVPCSSPFDHALTAAESLTGLVFATALILPSKKLADVKAKSVAKRIKEPRFAAKISRERIGHFREIGFEAEVFCSVAVEAMQNIAGSLESPSS